MRLIEMHEICILKCMKITINIDEELLTMAAQLTGIHDKAALVCRGLEALIVRVSSERLAKLGKSEKKLKPIPRRRSEE